MHITLISVKQYICFSSNSEQEHNVGGHVLSIFCILSLVHEKEISVNNLCWSMGVWLKKFPPFFQFLWALRLYHGNNSDLSHSPIYKRS